MKNYLLLGALVFSCLAPACGGDDDGATEKSGDATCGKVAACGGDLVGEWTVSDSCLAAGATMNCPEATVDTSGLSVVGSFSYKADGTYTSSGTTSGSITIALPATCLSQADGIVVTCQQLTESTKDDENPLTCTDATGGGCSCVTPVPTNTSTNTGTYKTSGTTVSTTTDGETSDNQYCVSGDYLHIILSTAGTSGGFVLTRK